MVNGGKVGVGETSIPPEDEDCKPLPFAEEGVFVPGDA
jgi:hypothetical protein